MSKKIFTILIILIVFIGSIAFFLIINRDTSFPQEVPQTDEDQFFPFDSITQKPGSGDGDDDQDVIVINADDSKGDDEEVDFVVVDSRFKQIFDKNVSGFLGFIQEVEEVVNPPREDVEGLTETYNFLDSPKLSLGDIHEKVEDLSIVLNRQGLDTELEVGDVFDINVKTALIEFQNKNDLESDGIVGPNTKRKLNEVQEISTDPEDYIPETIIVEFLKVRVQEKSNGHIHEYDEKTDSLKKITNTTLRGLHESFFGSNGDTIVSRYLAGDTIRTFIGDITEDDSALDGQTNNSLATLEGEFLVDDIPFISGVPGGDYFAYLVTDSFATQVFVHDLSSGEASKIISSKINEWLPQLINKNQVAITSRASYFTEGYSYLYGNSNGFKNIPDRLVGGVFGLTTNVSPDGERILYSGTSQDESLSTFVYNPNTNSEYNLGIETLAEKCSWKDEIILYCGVPKNIFAGELPDSWYKGEVLFDDSLWEINTETNVKQVILDPGAQTGGRFDLVNIQTVGDIVLFVNKHDETLWSFDLKQE